MGVKGVPESGTLDKTELMPLGSAPHPAEPALDLGWPLSPWSEPWTPGSTAAQLLPEPPQVPSCHLESCVQSWRSRTCSLPSARLKTMTVFTPGNWVQLLLLNLFGQTLRLGRNPRPRSKAFSGLKRLVAGSRFFLYLAAPCFSSILSRFSSTCSAFHPNSLLLLFLIPIDLCWPTCPNSSKPRFVREPWAARDSNTQSPAEPGCSGSQPGVQGSPLSPWCPL